MSKINHPKKLALFLINKSVKSNKLLTEFEESIKVLEAKKNYLDLLMPVIEEH
jgi:hypothetical protein